MKTTVTIKQSELLVKSRTAQWMLLLLAALTASSLLSISSSSTSCLVSPAETMGTVFQSAEVHDTREDYKVPPLLHFVNLSPRFPDSPPLNASAPPSDAEVTIQAWRDAMEPIGWKIMVWDNEAVDTAYPMLVPFLKRLATWSWMSNMLRYHILYDHGGIYLDTDIVPMVHETVDTNGGKRLNYDQVQMGLEALRNHHNFTVCERVIRFKFVPLPHLDQGYALPKEYPCRLACNAVIGVTPQHPSLKEMQHVAMENSLNSLHRKKYSTAISGPNPWTDVVSNKDDIAFLHPHTFYPCNWNAPKRCKLANFAQQNYTFAMHKWSHSWASAQ